MLTPGTILTSATGDWREVFCVTQLEIRSVSDVVIGGSGSAPSPQTITARMLTQGEVYESAVVRIDGPLRIAAVDLQLKLVTVESSDGVLFSIADTFGAFQNRFPTVGNRPYRQVTGVVRFFRGQTPSESNYFLAPRTPSDIF